MNKADYMKPPYTHLEIDKLRLKREIEKTYMLALVDYILRKYGMDDMADRIKQEHAFKCRRIEG